MGAGDGFCDDANNNCNCDWDAGDCCGFDNKYNYCTYCLCLDPDSDLYVNKVTTLPPTTKLVTLYPCDVACKKDAWRDDNYCDDDNNHCGCDWDGGDCCGADNKYTLCTDCACLDPDFTTLPATTTQAEVNSSTFGRL